MSRTLDGHACITVRDTGIGITPDLLPLVFDRFRQGDSSTTRTHGGLGLGLAIVKHLVELHDGEIEVTSPSRGLGTTFTITLPVHSDEEAAVRSAEPVLVDSSLLAGVRILVVDDEEDAARR